jgi:hypothetical protein
MANEFEIDQELALEPKESERSPRGREEGRDVPLGKPG